MKEITRLEIWDNRLSAVQLKYIKNAVHVVCISDIFARIRLLMRENKEAEENYYYGKGESEINSSLNMLETVIEDEDCEFTQTPNNKIEAGMKKHGINKYLEATK